MTDKKTVFITDDPQKFEILASEISDLKNVLVGLTHQARRIERRIDAVLPEKTKLRKNARAENNAAATANKFDEDKIKLVVDKLKEKIIAHQDIQAELRAMNVKYDLRPIARYFGMTNGPLPPKDELILNIITRLRQSVMIGENMRNMSRVAEDGRDYKKDAGS